MSRHGRNQSINQSIYRYVYNASINVPIQLCTTLTRHGISFYEQARMESINQSINLSICLQHLNQCSYSALHRFDSTWDHSMSRHGQNQSINQSIYRYVYNASINVPIQLCTALTRHGISLYEQAWTESINQSINLSICLQRLNQCGHSTSLNYRVGVSRRTKRWNKRVTLIFGSVSCFLPTQQCEMKKKNNKNQGATAILTRKGHRKVHISCEALLTSKVKPAFLPTRSTHKLRNPRKTIYINYGLSAEKS